METEIIYDPTDFEPHTGYAGVVAMPFGPELNLAIPGIISAGEQMTTLLRQWCRDRRYPEPVILRDRRAEPAGNDIAGEEGWPHGMLLYPDGQPRFQLLSVPGGNDQAFARELSHPRAVENIRAFVHKGGGYSGVCAGMCLAMQGYCDENDEPKDKKKVFANFTGLWPYLSLNLHGTRYLDFRFNPEIPEDHFLRQDFPGVLQQGRYNDGVALYKNHPHGYDPHTEYILEHRNDPEQSSQRLDGTWATIAYIDPAHPRAGRMVLNGWHPESSTTPEHHPWFFRCLEYALEHTRNMPPLLKSLEYKNKAVIGDNQMHFYRVGAVSGALLEAASDTCELLAACGRCPSPQNSEIQAGPGEKLSLDLSGVLPWVLAVRGTHENRRGENYTLSIRK